MLDRILILVLSLAVFLLGVQVWADTKLRASMENVASGKNFGIHKFQDGNVTCYVALHEDLMGQDHLDGLSCVK